MTTTREQRLRDWIAQCKAECMAYANTPIGVPVPKKLYLWNRLGDIEAILAEPVEVSVELTPMSFVTEMWPPDPGGMRSYMPRGVKVTHKPTGITVTCEHERSQHKNRDTAIRALRAALKEPGQ